MPGMAGRDLMIHDARLICADHLINSVKWQALLLFQNLMTGLSDVHGYSANKDN